MISNSWNGIAYIVNERPTLELTNRVHNFRSWWAMARKRRRVREPNKKKQIGNEETYRELADAVFNSDRKSL